MIFEPLRLPGLFLISPKRFGDARGFFSETFSQKLFNEHVGDTSFVQDNHSFSSMVGVLRGLHFQKPPYDQGKLVRVSRGKVLDVVVDIRRGSPTYGQSVQVELSADNWQQLWVPPGFAHGFLTLEPDTEFLYKVTNFYAPESEGGIRYDDPDLGIQWPIAADRLTLSDKDKILPLLRDFDTPFVYET